MTARKFVTSDPNDKNSTRSLLRLLFLLPALEALLAIGLIFGAPSEGSSAWLLGLSLSRWALVLGLAGLGIIFFILFWLNWRNHKVWPKIERAILRGLQKRWVYAIALVLSLLVAIVYSYLFLLTLKFTDALVQARLQRLLPLFVWLIAFCFQLLIIAPRMSYRQNEYRRQILDQSIWKPIAIAGGVLTLLVLFISITRFGLKPDRAGWDTPGVPLMATQIFIAWLGAALLYGFIWLVERVFEWRFSRIDFIATITLWLLAVVLWQSQQLTPTFFSPTPQPPNYEFYPYSDAASHDLVAQNLLIGQGFTPVSEKPLYSFFLAILHALVGQDYLQVVGAQIAVLALFPVALYLLAGQLNHRFSGLILALVVILRESNSIALSGDIAVSHSKLLMTDLPTALGVALFSLLVLKWLEADKQALRWPFLVGAAIGFLLLLRSQTVILLPILLLVALWQGGKSFKPRLVYAGILLLGFAMASLPWMARNYAAIGQVGYSQPLQALYLAKQYSLNPEASDPGFPENTPTSEYVSLGFSHVFSFVRTYPGEVTRFIGAHFLHNEISSLLVLPIRFDLSDKLVAYYNLLPYWEDAESRLWKECCSLDAHISNTPYWDRWNGSFPRDAWLPITVNLVLVALGIGAAWKSKGWLGLTPLGLHLVYNLSTAVARVSGWRLVLPVDWVLLLYYCFGLGQLSLLAWFYFFRPKRHKGKRKTRQKKAARQSGGQEKLAQIGAAILAAAILLPAAELLIPARYPELDANMAVNEWKRSDTAGQTPLNPAAFLDQPGAVALWGRALYPRFYAAGFGELGGQWPAFNPLPFSRLGFVLVGPRGENIILPLEVPPHSFPNGSDVLIFACREEAYLRAVGVIFLNDEAPDLLTDASTYSCAISP